MAFHVFVEGAVDPSPEGVERLAAAMAEQYGLPVADLRARLARGRFRVKGNCDRETADQYARDLGRIGARCAIEDADAAPSRTSSPLLPPSRTSSPSLPPRTTPPQSSPAITLPPRTSAPSNPPANYQSGLAAAFSGDVNVASLGALDDAAGALTLASVDGDDAPAAPPAAVFAPPPVAAAPSAAPSRPTPKPVDAFAPPDAGADLAVNLADEEVERAVAKKKASASMPPLTAPAAAASASAMPAAAPVIAAPKTYRLGFALGVVVALVIGFVPAQLYASSREASIKAEVQKRQREADTPDAYDELDAFRTQKLGQLHDTRQNAAILAILLWAACGGGLAFAFRGR